VTHDIIGCEASLDGPERRLAHFSQAHGMIVMFPRRRARIPARAAILTLAVAVIVVLALTQIGA